MNFIESYKYSVDNLNTFSLNSLKQLALKHNLPFVKKSQIINLLAYELIIPYFEKVAFLTNETLLRKQVYIIDPTKKALLSIEQIKSIEDSPLNMKEMLIDIFIEENNNKKEAKEEKKRKRNLLSLEEQEKLDFEELVTELGNTNIRPIVKLKRPVRKRHVQREERKTDDIEEALSQKFKKNKI